ncbi:phage major tail tube protein [Escherichia coli]|nr:phage major tail tube protein [Escherichia coli]
MEIVVRGRHTEIDFGNAKAGSKDPFKVKSSLSYYKLSVNGEDWIEIDHVNFIERVFGVDRLAEQRKAIGLCSFTCRNTRHPPLSEPSPPWNNSPPTSPSTPPSSAATRSSAC